LRAGGPRRRTALGQCGWCSIPGSEEILMQRPVTVLVTSLLAGLLSTGCPEKRAEKEEPAAPTAEEPAAPKAAKKTRAEDKAAIEDERGDEAEEHVEEAKEEKKSTRKKPVEKKEAAPEEKDPGGW
jgi:hypothetical protein